MNGLNFAPHLTQKKNTKMYKKTLLLLVFVFSCLLSSCRATRQEIQKTETQTQVTSEKVVTYKDTTVFAPKAETNLKIPLSELLFKNPLNSNSKPIIYTQKNGQAKVKLKIVHDTISISATCDSLALVAKIKNEFKKESSNVIKNNNIESKQKTGYSFIHIGIAFLLGFAFCYIIKFFKIV
jgi:hypothetical protein